MARGNKGDGLERSVYLWLKREVARGSLGVNRSAKVRRSPSYYSSRRGGDIKFDVSIEVARPASSAPWLLWIWECKDHAREIDALLLEQFHAKLEQVGPDRTKGMMVTTSTVRPHALQLARSYGMGVIEVQDAGKSLQWGNVTVHSEAAFAPRASDAKAEPAPPTD